MKLIKVGSLFLCLFIFGLFFEPVSCSIASSVHELRDSSIVLVTGLWLLEHNEKHTNSYFQQHLADLLRLMNTRKLAHIFVYVGSDQLVRWLEREKCINSNTSVELITIDELYSPPILDKISSNCTTKYGTHLSDGNLKRMAHLWLNKMEMMKITARTLEEAGWPLESYSFVWMDAGFKDRHLLSEQSVWPLNGFIRLNAPPSFMFVNLYDYGERCFQQRKSHVTPVTDRSINHRQILTETLSCSQGPRFGHHQCIGSIIQMNIFLIPGVILHETYSEWHLTLTEMAQEHGTTQAPGCPCLDEEIVAAWMFARFPLRFQPLK